ARHLLVREDKVHTTLGKDLLCGLPRICGQNLEILPHQRGERRKNVGLIVNDQQRAFASGAHERDLASAAVRGIGNTQNAGKTTCSPYSVRLGGSKLERWWGGRVVTRIGPPSHHPRTSSRQSRVLSESNGRPTQAWEAARRENNRIFRRITLDIGH